MKGRRYLCIDLKSFFASVECVERGLDPMTTNLVVADPDRTDKTICLAITPAMKALGVKNRCRMFEIPKGIDYIIASPRMQKYIDYAAEIYAVYLTFVSKEDIFVYSIDEVFIDVTDYLYLYKTDAKRLAQRIMDKVLERVGVRATCGIGTNLYLAKIALDITAKHAEDFIGYLDEELYIKNLWQHRPLTDFWRIGPGIAKSLGQMGIYTMEGIAKANQDALYSKFGIDAELLIDHAWGMEPTTMKDIKKYKPKTTCISSGQVLMRDYTFSEAEIIVKEMMDLICLEMVDRGAVTKSITLHVGYSNKLNIKPAGGTIMAESPTNADCVLVPLVAKLYKEITDSRHPVRRINITCNNLVSEESFYEQLSLFEDVEKIEKNKKIQKAMLKIKKQFGKNSVFKAVNLEEVATTLERNRQIGGHKSGE